MLTVVQRKSAIEHIRLLATERVRDMSDAELLRVIDHVDDADLAVCALLMVPRPAWVQKVATGG